MSCGRRVRCPLTKGDPPHAASPTIDHGKHASERLTARLFATLCSSKALQGSGRCFKLVSFENLQAKQKNMNRRKKITQLLKAHAKLAPQKKAKYISKADRLKLAAQDSTDAATDLPAQAPDAS